MQSCGEFRTSVSVDPSLRGYPGYIRLTVAPGVEASFRSSGEYQDFIQSHARILADIVAQENRDN